MPATQVQVTQLVGVSIDISNKPTRKAIPLPKVCLDRMENPAALFRAPIRLPEIPRCGCRNPVRLDVLTAPGDWLEVIDDGKQFPMGSVGRFHLPVWVAWEFIREQPREESQYGWRYQPLARVAIQKTVAHEDARFIGLVIPSRFASIARDHYPTRDDWWHCRPHLLRPLSREGIFRAGDGFSTFPISCDKGRANAPHNRCAVIVLFRFHCILPTYTESASNETIARG